MELRDRLLERYDKHFETGNYHCADCDKLLFSSDSKFDSGCGWPAFSEEDESANITQLKDTSHGMVRIEAGVQVRLILVIYSMKHVAQGIVSIQFV